MATSRMATTRKAAQSPCHPVLFAEFAALSRLFMSLFDPYHPELHYMRGPGPKWHAKHRCAPAEAHDAPGLFLKA